MATVVAVKLPHGLTITHNARTINLNGQNIDSNPIAPLINGATYDIDAKRSGGFGLTELTDAKDEEAFKAWVKAVTYTDDGTTKLESPFAPLENGSIMVYPNMKAAMAESKTLSDAITTGFEGIDPKAAGVDGLTTQDDPK